ncbi:MAG TPA: GTP cyclohydrolase I FolE [Chloroflexota bacterium]|nr:GTP cyclohydrolase I FolE [Chloroflexota bacterium]
MIDRPAITRLVADLLRALGEDPTRQGLQRTPERVADMYAEIFGGLHEDPAALLQGGFDEQHEEMVVLRDIRLQSVCEHHLLPFVGTAHVGYIPHGRVIGVDKLAHVVDILARRPQVQERLTSQIADLINEHLKPRGVAVVVTAEHLCMTLRGLRAPGSTVVTSANRGAFRTREATRLEFFALLNNKR